MVVTLKYNKSGMFNLDETNFQNFIEGTTDGNNNMFQYYELKQNGWAAGKFMFNLDYSLIKSPITIYNDDITKTMFWIIPIRCPN